jgi:hypothetical protein
MATYTPNLNLGKPAVNDQVKDFLALFNANMDILDGLGNGVTYTLSISSHTITLNGSDGLSSAVTVPDADTTYTFTISGDVITITDSDGNSQTVTVPSGDSVSWTQLQATGTKIAEIDINGTSQDVYAPKPPSKTSELNNDSGFITNTVNNLANYYLKSETYTQAEVDALIAAIVTIDIQVVASLPISDISTTTIYLVPTSDPELQNIYDEYINTDGTSGGWELIGTTAIDLSNYVTTTDLATALASYVTSASLTTILGNYVLSSSLAAVATSGQYSDLSGKPTIPTKTSDLVNDSGFTSVSVNQVQTSGTKIAEITVSGTQTDLYSPGFDPQQQINEILEEIGVLGYWEDTDSRDNIVTHDGDYIGFRTESNILAWQ